MKGVLPWLVRWALHAGTRDFFPVLGCSSRASTKYFFPRPTLCHFICHHRPATSAGSRAWPPVSYCVSPIAYLDILKVWWQDATLLVYFSYFITYIHSSHSYNTFVHRHSLRLLSISSLLVCSVGNTSLWCCTAEPRFSISTILSHAAP
jgi:hypothetical protein